MMRLIIYFLFVAICLIGCEDPISPDLEESSNSLIIDAFVTNVPGEQHIYINRSIPYFEQDFLPKVEGAIVYVDDLTSGTRYDFTENDSSYSVSFSDTLNAIDHIFRLTVEVEEQIYQAFSDMGRVPPVDSIKFSFVPEDPFIDQDYYLAEFVSRDFNGPGDTYWIRAWKNGQELNEPNEINVAFDAGFSAGSNIDGEVFVQPIQNAINPIDLNENDEFIAPYLVGDSVYVEIHSINEATFFFFQELQTQTDRPGGFGALFAQPLANVPTNIFNVNEEENDAVRGFFNVAAVSAAGLRLTDPLAAKAREEYEREN